MATMSLRVVELDDPVAAYDAGARLSSWRTRREHNLLLTCSTRAASTRWPAGSGSSTTTPTVVGFAMQSPPGRRVGARRVDAATPRSACWPRRSRRRCPVWSAKPAARRSSPGTSPNATRARSTPVEAPAPLRAPRCRARRDGARRAPARGRDDRPTLVEWARDFAAETGTPREIAEDERRSRHRRASVSGCGTTAGRSRWRARRRRPPGWRGCSACTRRPSARGAGYATACVEHLSRALTDRGLRCVLFTQLSNPTSNAIYRRIGYAAGHRDARATTSRDSTRTAAAADHGRRRRRRP